VDHGCIFVGRRSEVGAHEKNCECIPRSVLRDRVAHLEAAILQQGGRDDNLVKALQHIHGFAQVYVHDRTALQNGVQKDLWHSMAFSFKPERRHPQFWEEHLIPHFNDGPGLFQL
jgi:hypothetical protein